jgi:hypothetical protein
VFRISTSRAARKPVMQRFRVRQCRADLAASPRSCDEPAMGNCKLCQDNVAESNGLCEKCMDTLGIIEMPPPRRRPTPCLKCNSMKFIRVIPRAHSVRLGIDRNQPELAPLTLTQAPKLDPRLSGNGFNVIAPSVVLGDGMLEAYTCLKCGFVEWYVEDPEEIPIGPEYMSEVIDYESDAPYR